MSYWIKYLVLIIDLKMQNEIFGSKWLTMMIGSLFGCWVFSDDRCKGENLTDLKQLKTNNMLFSLFVYAFYFAGKKNILTFVTNV